MTDPTHDARAQTSAYLGEVFGPLGEPIDDQLATLMDRAAEAGLPRISVSPDVGRLLMVLASLAATPGAGRAVEVGTLGGYSGLWIARGLGEGGLLRTIEADPKHAAFARAEFDRSGLGERVEVREGEGLGVLPRLTAELGEGSCDLVFLDAIKTEYRAYAEHSARLLRPGGLLVADNALAGGSWRISDASGSDESRDAMDAFNRWIGSPASGFLGCCVTNRQGLAVACRA